MRSRPDLPSRAPLRTARGGGAKASLRLAFLGCGAATEAHARVLRAAERTPGLWFASRDGAAAQAALARHGGAGMFADYRAALADPQIDAVVIATPPASHLELTLAALAAGKHVVVEPAFPRVEDFDEVAPPPGRSACSTTSTCSPARALPSAKTVGPAAGAGGVRSRHGRRRPPRLASGRRSRRSASWSLDAPARTHMLGVVGEQLVTELDDLPDSRIADAVVHDTVLATRVDEPAPAQTCEVVGHLRLRDAEGARQLADGVLTLAEQLEDPDPRRVAQTPEVLGHHLRFAGLVGEAEGYGLGRLSRHLALKSGNRNGSPARARVLLLGVRPPRLDGWGGSWW